MGGGGQAERIATGDGFTPCTYATDPSRPIGRWEEAWEAGVPFSVVAAIMGWSASTTVRMAKRYGHIGQAAQRQAVAALSGADLGAMGHKIGHSPNSIAHHSAHDRPTLGHLLRVCLPRS